MHNVLARRTFKGELPGFLCWLRFVAGHEHQGQWYPAGELDEAHCFQLISRLSDHQLDQLRWRRLIPDDITQSIWSKNLRWSESARVYKTPSKAYVVDDPTYRTFLYGLPTGEECQLQEGELELLVAAGFPTCWTDLLSVLWRRIASPTPAPPPLAERVQDISVLLQARHATTQLARRWEAIRPAALTTKVSSQLRGAERAVIRAALAIVREGSQESELAAAVQALQNATNLAQRDADILLDLAGIP